MTSITVWLLMAISPIPTTISQHPDEISCLVAAADVAIKAVDAGTLDAGTLVRVKCVKSEIVK